MGAEVLGDSTSPGWLVGSSPRVLLFAFSLTSDAGSGSARCQELAGVCLALAGGRKSVSCSVTGVRQTAVAVLPDAVGFSGRWDCRYHISGDSTGWSQLLPGPRLA